MFCRDLIICPSLAYFWNPQYTAQKSNVALALKMFLCEENLQDCIPTVLVTEVIPQGECYSFSSRTMLATTLKMDHKNHINSVRILTGPLGLTWNMSFEKNI